MLKASSSSFYDTLVNSISSSISNFDDEAFTHLCSMIDKEKDRRGLSPKPSMSSSPKSPLTKKKSPKKVPPKSKTPPTLDKKKDSIYCPVPLKAKPIRGERSLSPFDIGLNIMPQIKAIKI